MGWRGNPSRVSNSVIYLRFLFFCTNSRAPCISFTVLWRRRRAEDDHQLIFTPPPHYVGEVGAKRAPGVKRATRISKNKRHSHERNYCELMWLSGWNTDAKRRTHQLTPSCWMSHVRFRAILLYETVILNVLECAWMVIVKLFVVKGICISCYPSFRWTCS